MTQPSSRASARSRRSRADYRWTVPKAYAFLQALARCGNVAAAAREVGMSRQSAYRLRARLADGPWWEGFELARAAGLAAREAPPPRSRWEGPGLDALARVRTAGPAQGDASGTQGDASPRQSDASGPQGDGAPRKVTLSDAR